MSAPKDNRALWLSSFSSPLELKTFPIPAATQGSVVVRVLSTMIVPYAKAVHTGKLKALNLKPPFVPNPGSIGRVHEVGSDSVKFKPGDLVFVEPTIRARDNPKVVIMQGHHGGDDEEPQRKLMREWRDGALQQFYNVPLENCFALSETQLLKDLKYTPPELTAIIVYMVAAGALIEAANVKIGETVVIGPSGGSFGGAAVEMALAIGANVIALGRSEAKLEAMKKALGGHERFKCVAMTGDVEKDTAAILQATPEGAGFEVYNDWTPGAQAEPLYLPAATHAIKSNGRVIMSGGATGNVVFPHLILLHKNLTIQGKFMYSADIVQTVISMITAGILKIGRSAGAEVTVYGLEQHHEAVDNAAKNGGWRNYTIIAPNSE